MAYNENNKNVKYAGQLVNIARPTLRFVVDDMLRMVTDADETPFLNVFAPQSIYRFSILDTKPAVQGEDNSGKKIYLANLPLQDLAIIEERTKMAERIIFDTNNKCGFADVKAEIAKNRGLLQKFISMLKKGGEKTATVTPLNEQEMNILSATLPYGTYGKKSVYAVLAELGSEAVPELERCLPILKDNASKYRGNQKTIDAIELGLKALKEGRIAATANASPELAGDDAKDLEIYTSAMKYLSANYSDKEGRRRWYQIRIMCHPGMKAAYSVTLRNCYAFIKENPDTKLTQMDSTGVVWEEKKMNLTEGEWLYIVREMCDNMENARLCFYNASRKEDVNRRFANRTSK